VKRAGRPSAGNRPNPQNILTAKVATRRYPCPCQCGQTVTVYLTDGLVIVDLRRGAES
jgi:hypothetical protein